MMNASKLIRQLRREALAHPKKAAILGLLLLVALYYWGPLVWRWVAPDQASGEPSAAKADAKADAGIPAAIASAQPSAPSPDENRSHPWTQLDQWMTQDPMTTPAEDVARWRDPFTVAATVAKVDEHAEAQSSQSRATPESLGLELTGTLVGPRRRVALIGGQAYKEGQTVKTNRDGRPIEFALVEVYPKRIVLEREGNRFDLAIPEQENAGPIKPSGHQD